MLLRWVLRIQRGDRSAPLPPRGAVVQGRPQPGRGRAAAALVSKSYVERTPQHWVEAQEGKDKRLHYKNVYNAEGGGAARHPHDQQGVHLTSASLQCTRRRRLRVHNHQSLGVSLAADPRANVRTCPLTRVPSGVRACTPTLPFHITPGGNAVLAESPPDPF